MQRLFGISATKLAKELNLSVAHALYRESGDWYHLLKVFPAVLMDVNGFVVFSTQKEYEECPELKITKHIHVKQGISSIESYRKFPPNFLELSKISGPRRSSFSDQKGIKLAEEVGKGDHFEGAATLIKVIKYERDRKARAACLKHFGFSCFIRSFDFRSIYGEIGEVFIHVHHLIPISAIKKEYRLNPLVDLIPICPNCHAIVHRKLSAILTRGSQRNAQRCEELRIVWTNKVYQLRRYLL